MENALAFQRLESKGLYASTILREGMYFADDSIRVALVDPESDQAIQVVANQVLQRETQRDRQNTANLVISQLPDLTAGQILQDMQYINREAMERLAWVATHGNPREVEFARQALGLAPQPEPHFENDEEDPNRESFLERAKRSEIVFVRSALAPRRGWQDEIVALGFLLAPEPKKEARREEIMVEEPVVERRAAPIGTLRALTAFVDVPESPKRLVKVEESETAEYDN